MEEYNKKKNWCFVGAALPSNEQRELRKRVRERLLRAEADRAEGRGAPALGGREAEGPHVPGAAAVGDGRGADEPVRFVGRRLGLYDEARALLGDFDVLAVPKMAKRMQLLLSPTKHCLRDLTLRAVRGMRLLRV